MDTNTNTQAKAQTAQPRLQARASKQQQNEAHVHRIHHWCTSCNTADRCNRIIATASLLCDSGYSPCP